MARKFRTYGKVYTTKPIISAAAGGGLVKTWNGLAYASVKTINGLAVASIKTINNLASQ